MRDLDIDDLREQILQSSTTIDDLERIWINADKLKPMCKQAIKLKRTEHLDRIMKGSQTQIQT